MIWTKDRVNWRLVSPLEGILENGTVNGVHIGSQFTGPSHQIPSLPNWVYKKTSVRTFNCPGMSSNEWAKKRHQRLKILLGCRSLRHTKSLKTWHDIIKNTMWKPSSSEYRPYSFPKLIEMLKLLKPRIAAIVYCLRSLTWHSEYLERATENRKRHQRS